MICIFESRVFGARVRGDLNISEMLYTYFKSLQSQYKPISSLDLACFHSQISENVPHPTANRQRKNEKPNTYKECDLCETIRNKNKPLFQ